MAQDFTDDVYGGAHVGQTDLQNMENNFTALKSSFSGAAQPGNAVAGMVWFDTTQKVMKQRDAANATWIGLLHGDVSQKLWVYRDSAMDGWVVDSGVTDTVLAIKGGSDAYDTVGGSTAGTWTQPRHSHALTGNTHAHSLTKTEGGLLQQGTTMAELVVFDAGSGDQIFAKSGAETGPFASRLMSSLSESEDGANSPTNIDGTVITWRPEGAVGTLQYPDL